MKFCLSAQQTDEYLSQADEIRVLSRDLNKIFDLSVKYPNKTIIYNLENLEFNKKELQKLIRLCRHQLVLALYNLTDVDFCKKEHIPFFYAHPCKTLDQIKALKQLGVNQILIDEPLTHMLHQVKKFGIPIRAIPVYAYLDNIPRENGVAGNWFRPEDVEAYSVYIDTIEFGYQPQKRERALFRIYAQDREWPGDLGRIISDLNYFGINRMLNPEYTKKRMNCGMICSEGKCHICYSLLDLAQEEKMRELASEIHETSGGESQTNNESENK